MTGPGHALLGLGAAAVALLVLAGRTARPPLAALPDPDGYADRWQRLHGGYDPRTGSVWVRGWLGIVQALGRPLAQRGVQPDVLTLTAVWAAGLVVALSGLGGRWPLLAGVVLVASGMLDNLDGCVALLQGRASRWGYVLDSAVDRVSDAAYLLAAVLVGCPVWLAAATAFAVLLMEYVRARSGAAGGSDVGVVTVAERPTRVLVLAPVLLLSGLVPAAAPVIATAGAAVLLALTTAALAHLLAVARRELVGLPPRSLGDAPRAD